MWKPRRDSKSVAYESRAEFEADRQRRWKEGWAVRSVDEHHPRRFTLGWLGGFGDLGSLDGPLGFAVLLLLALAVIVSWFFWRRKRGTEVAVEYERAAPG